MRSLFFILILAQLPTFPKGCSEFYPDEPAHLHIENANGLSVTLAWDKQADASEYRVRWYSTDSSGVMTEDDSLTSEQSISVKHLHPGRTYTFEVRAIKKGALSSAGSIEWTSADLYTTDQMTGQELRLYERAAPAGKGSGLILNPQLGGPMVTYLSKQNPLAGEIQIAGYPEGYEVPIGPARGFYDLPVAPLTDGNILVSDTFFVIQSLEEWDLPKTLDNYFTTNRSTRYKGIAIQQPFNKGVGFLVSVGTERHYARIFVKPNAEGTLVNRDEEGYRYIAIEVLW